MRGHSVLRRAATSLLAIAWIAFALPGSTAGAVPPGSNLCDLGSRTSSTSGADLLIGTPGSDSLAGGAGDDMILGCGGADTINGQEGNDLLIGGQGDDAIDGGPDDDIFEAGEYHTYDRYLEPGTPIPCCGPANAVSLSFTVQPEEIRSIQVRLDVSHARPADLKVKLFTPVSPFAGGDVVLTDVNCYGPSSSTNRCGPGQFHNPASVETGVIFNADSSVSIQQSGAKNKDLNGLFHPRGTLDRPFRFQPSCGDGMDCTYRLEFTDAVANGIDGTINYAAIDLQPGNQTDGTDSLTGGTGVSDLATYVSRDGSVTYTGEDNVANDGAGSEDDNVRNDIEWFYGGAGNDSLTGTNNTNGGFNDLRGMLGKDTVRGLAGNDRLDVHGTWGSDRLFGDDGNDWLDGGTTKAVDSMTGGAGTDRCVNGRTTKSCEQFQ